MASAATGVTPSSPARPWSVPIDLHASDLHASDLHASDPHARDPHGRDPHASDPHGRDLSALIPPRADSGPPAIQSMSGLSGVAGRMAGGRRRATGVRAAVPQARNAASSATPMAIAPTPATWIRLSRSRNSTQAATAAMAANSEPSTDAMAIPCSDATV